MSENPYAPPSSAVADVDNSAHIERPWLVKVALTLCWVSFALALPLAAEAFLQEVKGHRDSSPTYFAFMIFFLATTLGLIAWVIISIGRMRNWARIVYTALTAWKLFSVLSSFPGNLDRTWYSGPVEMLGIALDVVAGVLLYLPVANAWFRTDGRLRAEGKR